MMHLTDCTRYFPRTRDEYSWTYTIRLLEGDRKITLSVNTENEDEAVLYFWEWAASIYSSEIDHIRLYHARREILPFDVADIPF